MPLEQFLPRNIDGLAAGRRGAPALGRLAGGFAQDLSRRRRTRPVRRWTSANGLSALSPSSPVAGAIAGAFGAKKSPASRRLRQPQSQHAGHHRQRHKAAAEIGCHRYRPAPWAGSQSTTKAYTNWLASIKAPRWKAKRGPGRVQAVAGSMAKLGKSSADTEGAMMPWGRWCRKGTVSMENARTAQPSTPSAMQAAADGAGITVQRLRKDGWKPAAWLAEDLLPGWLAHQAVRHRRAGLHRGLEQPEIRRRKPSAASPRARSSSKTGSLQHREEVLLVIRHGAAHRGGRIRPHRQTARHRCRGDEHRQSGPRPRTRSSAWPTNPRHGSTKARQQDRHGWCHPARPFSAEVKAGR